MPSRNRRHGGPVNRRAFPRVVRHFDVRLVQGGASGRETTVVKAIEISEGGLSFRTDEPLAPGEELFVEYRLPASAQWVRVKCAVRHISKERIGIEFLTLRRADRLKIVELLGENA